MDFRCQHCGHRIVPATLSATRAITCPNCGRVVELPHTPPSGAGAHRASPDVKPARANQRRLRRIFNPIPRPFVYLVGVALALAALAPFWLYLLKDRLEHQRPVLSDDAMSLPMPTPASTETTRPAPVIEEPHETVANSIDEFAGIRLNADIEQLQQHFALQLQNERGMVPEIYEASRIGKIDAVTMHFYNNRLKEFWVEMAERRVVPDTIERELTERFGQPTDRKIQTARQGDDSLSLALTTADHRFATDGQNKFARFPYRVDLLWSDEETTTRATIHYSSPKPETCVSILTVHVSAAQWLNNNRPELAASALSTTNAPDQTNQPPAAAPPPRPFPSP
ncbi:MAG TPA: hypothetical protein VMP11_06525 [Verrucomicrobiae bacterium]|nr:hypothetical protein [Verrucomicrobiae bacterium]